MVPLALSFDAFAFEIHSLDRFHVIPDLIDNFTAAVIGVNVVVIPMVIIKRVKLVNQSLIILCGQCDSDLWHLLVPVATSADPTPSRPLCVI
jgi:hypothetical protein